jgi:hypothetical protein
MKLKYVCLLLGLLASLWTTAFAEDEIIIQHNTSVDLNNPNTEIKFAVPRHSNYKYAGQHERSAGDHSAAKFVGRAVISGTYHYRYPTEEELSGDELVIEDKPILYFSLDPESMGLLPYVAGRAVPADFFFTNPEQFIEVFIPRKIQASIQSNRQLSVIGKAKIEVGNFIAGIECDTAYYGVAFIKKIKTSRLEVARGSSVLSGCG